MKIRFTLFVAALALLFSLAVLPTPTAKAFATLVVDDNNAECPGATHNTIQAAVNAASPGDTIQVCAGTYNENVNIPAALSGLTLNGAQAGNPVAGRVFGSPTESTVRGANLTAGIAVLTVRAPNVTIDGFSVTVQVTSGAAFGITVTNGGDGALITNNILDTITSPDPSGAGTAQAVYLENSTSVAAPDGPDNVSVIANRMNNILSSRSAKGVLIGVNNGTNPSQNAVIRANVITNVVSEVRGAYGISVANPVSSTSGVTGLVIHDNTISGLVGGTGAACPPAGSPPTVPAACGWVHAIGLEGNTPGVDVLDNEISNLNAATPDRAAVFFQSNPSFPTAEVHDNNFNVGNTVYGIALHPALLAANIPGAVDGECNWWGAPNGPGPVGTGAGALVTPQVDYTPWQTSPDGACVGPDADNDGITDADDNCPNAANPGQADADDDGAGDVCDPDDDNDGVNDGSDACPGTPPGTTVGSTGCALAVNKDQCKNGGWKTLFRADGSPFKNQGDCIQYVNTGK